jgi:hypothetical protein
LAARCPIQARFLGLGGVVRGIENYPTQGQNRALNGAPSPLPISQDVCVVESHHREPASSASPGPSAHSAAFSRVAHLQDDNLVAWLEVLAIILPSTPAAGGVTGELLAR